MTNALCFKKQRARLFFRVCLHAIHIHHQVTHTSLLAVRQLTFCFPRTTDLFLKQAAKIRQLLWPSANPHQQQVPSCSSRKEQVYRLCTPTPTRTGEEGSKHQAGLIQPELGHSYQWGWWAGPRSPFLQAAASSDACSQTWFSSRTAKTPITD